MNDPIYRKPILDNKGNVAITTGLLLVGVLMLVGGAIDFRTASNKQLAVQAVLDNAVLYAMQDDSNPKKIAKTAETYFIQNVQSYKSNDLQYKVRFWLEDTTLHGEFKGTIETSLLALGGQDRMNISANSGAVNEPSLQPLCFMAMHPSRKHTLELKDAVSVYAPDCHIYGNSNHPDDVVDPHEPENFLTGKSIQAIGYGHHYLENVSPPLEYAKEKIADPLAKLYIPKKICGPSGSGAKKISGGNVKLKPGNYCGGLSISGGAKVELSKGTYIISGGLLEVLNATISSKDATIILTDGATINFENANINMEAPKNGTYAGIAIAAEREEGLHFITHSMIDVHGVAYIPNGTFVWENKGTSKPKHKWTAWIVDGVTWMGSGTIYYNFEPNKGSVPYPSELNVIPRPLSKLPRLLH